MTETTLNETTPAAAPSPAPALSLARMRLRQLGAVLRLEVRRTLLRRRALGVYFLALLPVGMFALWALVVAALGQTVPTGEITTVFAAVYRHLWLAVMVFFACAHVFGNSVRREVLERTLHFYLLLPVRRELLLAGKYLGAVVAVGSVFAAAVAATLLIAYLPAGGPAMGAFFLHGPGIGHLFAYLGVTLLAVVGYGSVFLTLGLFFRRPAVPVLAIFGWEWINFLLPPLLKRISVSYYLGSLTPVPVPEGPFALLADAPSPVAAVVGLLVLSVVLLAVSGWKLRRTEILYGED